MKIYIVYCCRDYDEPQAIAPNKEEAEKMIAMYKKHDPNHSHIYWIEEKTLKNQAIEI